MKTKRILGTLMLVITIFVMGLAIVYNWGCNLPFDLPLTLGIIFLNLGGIILIFIKQ